MKVRTREEYREIVDDWFTVKREFWDIESELKTLINKLISEKDGDNLCTLYDDLNRIEMEIMHKKNPKSISEFRFRSKGDVRKLVYELYGFIDKYYPFFDVIEVAKALSDLSGFIYNGTESFGYHIHIIKLDFNTIQHL